MYCLLRQELLEPNLQSKVQGLLHGARLVPAFDLRASARSVLYIGFGAFGIWVGAVDGVIRKSIRFGPTYPTFHGGAAVVAGIVAMLSGISCIWFSVRSIRRGEDGD